MRPSTFRSVLPAPPQPVAAPIEQDEYEVADALVTPQAVLAETTTFARTLVREPATALESAQRIALLHALVAQEIDFRRDLEEAIPAWMLTALDETEWASGPAGVGDI
jgi:hypothetical protein